MTKVASRLQIFSFQFTKLQVSLQTCISDFYPACVVIIAKIMIWIIWNVESKYDTITRNPRNNSFYSILGRHSLGGF